MKKKGQGARIYNLFPRLVGRMENWGVHFDRVVELGFDWVYINPFHYPGFSGSLYAPKDYYDFNPLFVDLSALIPPMKQLENMIEEAHKRGIKMIMDLVINHTAKDHPFTKQRPTWYQHNEKGEIKSPGAWDGGNYIEWGDLAEIDNEHSPDKNNVWQYWKELVLFYIGKGFDGFRADAAYAVPSELWSYLISSAKTENPDVTFFAESLGCSPEQTLALANSGFQYIFNSSKWWNYTDQWLIDQYNQTKDICASIAFPESHDTNRLSMEQNNNLPAIKQKTIFSALFSTGWMIPVGYEFGFRKKLDVIQTTPNDWEPINYDLSGVITKLNKIRDEYAIFSEECSIDFPKLDNAQNLLYLLKTPKTGKDKVLLIINKDTNHNQKAFIKDFRSVFQMGEKMKLSDISVDNPMNIIPENNFEYILNPSEVRVLYAKEATGKK